DFNDFHQQSGLEAVRAAIDKAAEPEACRAADREPEPLPDELLPVAAFDFDLLPDALRPWAADICDRMQCPPDFVGAGIMAALAGVIGRKVAIRPQARTDWAVVCNVWALIVGRPGVLKSPALEQALAHVKRLAAIAADQHQEAEAAFQIESQAAKLKKEAAEKSARQTLAKNPDADLKTVLAVDEVAAPQLKRYIANDTSPASLGELLRQNPNGLLVFRDEVVSLLKSLDREGQEEGRGFYLTAWNGDSPYTFDRIGRGLNLHIPAVCLSVLGGTQPGRLSEYIRQAVKGGAADDGLIQRFGLLVWPDTNGKWQDVDRWPDTDAKNRAFKVFDYLDSLDPLEIGAQQDTDQEGEAEGPPFLRFEPTALEHFQEWRGNLEKRLRGELHPALESHFAKYRKLIPSIALICHLADGGTGPVTEKSTLRALAWSEYLESHAQRAYGSVSQPEISVAKAILRRIKKGDLPGSFGSRDVWRPGWAKLTDRDQVKEALRLLEDYNWITRERIEGTGGRPKTIFHVNEQAKL
ncbi:MAG: YfjI family protein, partial [Thermodesulfobacteriota bacterium]|nr:YfjI family protein [Thermodesulfobacteriota bacterium]